MPAIIKSKEKTRIMDDVGRWLLSGACYLLAVLATAVFSGFGSALQNVPESRLHTLQEEGNLRAGLLLRDKEAETSVSLFCRGGMVVSLAAGCLGAAALLSAESLTRLWWLCGMIPVGVLCGIYLPGQLAVQSAERSVLRYDRLFRVFHTLLYPVVGLLLQLSRLLLRLCGINPDREQTEITEDEIRLLVEEGNEAGAIDLSEMEMIHNVFEFDDRVAADIMTPRTELFALSMDTPIADAVPAVTEEGFSRIPVYGEDIDHIEGILYVKDLLPLIGTREARSATAGDCMRPVLFVPDTTRCRELFVRLKEQRTHMAVVLDEYGGTAGIVTMEDLLESIVGNIQDEYDEEEEEICRIDEDTYIFDGAVTVDEAERVFGEDFAQNDPADTMGGLVVNTLGRIPEEGETPRVQIGDIELQVLLAEDRRVVRLQAHRIRKEGKE